MVWEEALEEAWAVGIQLFLFLHSPSLHHPHHHLLLHHRLHPHRHPHHLLFSRRCQFLRLEEVLVPVLEVDREVVLQDQSFL